MYSIKKTAIFITIISIVCKLFGFGREILLAYFFGTSYIVDAYLMASSIPTILFGWLTSVAISFTPLYTDIRLNKGNKISDMFTNNVISTLFIVSIVCALTGIILNKQIISIVAPGFSGDVFDLTSRYLYMSICMVLFIGPVQILSSYLNCESKFINSNISSLVISSIQMLFVIVAGKISINLLIFGPIIAMICQFVILGIFTKRLGYRFKFSIKFTPEVRKAFVLMVPIFISSMISQINNFVDKSFASGLVEGSISALNYGAILRGFIFTVFSIAITTIIYPMLSKAFAEKNIESVKTIFSKALNIIIVLFVPITVGAIILAKPAITFVFQRGEFNVISSNMTTSAFIMYNISLIAIALHDVITKVFYSMQDTVSILCVGAFTVISNIVLNLLLIKSFGHTGLALATSLSAIISLPLLFFILRKKLGSLGLKYSGILLVKASISTLIMGFTVYILYNNLTVILGQGKLLILLALVIAAVVGSIIYFTLMILLKVKEIDFFTDILKKAICKIKRT